MRRPNRMDVFANILYVLQTTICIEDGPTMNLNWTSVERPFEQWVDNSVHELLLKRYMIAWYSWDFLLNFNLWIRLNLKSLFDVGLFIVTSAILAFTWFTYICFSTRHLKNFAVVLSYSITISSIPLPIFGE